MSSQPYDLYAEIYGVHPSSNKHMKKFFYRETKSLQYFCWTCGWSLHLGPLQQLLWKTMPLFVWVECLCSHINTFPHGGSSLPGFSVQMVTKYLLLIITVELFIQKSIKHRFHSFFNILEHSCIFFNQIFLLLISCLKS